MNAVFKSIFYAFCVVFGLSFQTHLWATDPVILAQKMHARAQLEDRSDASALKIIDHRRPTPHRHATARKRSLERIAEETDLLIMAPLSDADTAQSIQEFSVEPASTKACVLVLKKSCLPAHTPHHLASLLTLHRIIVLINDSETPTPAWLASIAETVIDVPNLVAEPNEIIKRMIKDLLNKNEDEESSGDDRDDDDPDYEKKPPRSHKKSAKKCSSPAATATETSSATFYKKVHDSLLGMLPRLGGGFDLFVSNITAREFSGELDRQIAHRETKPKTGRVHTPLLVTSLNNYKEALARAAELNEQNWIVIFIIDNQAALAKMHNPEARKAVTEELYAFHRFILAQRDDDRTYLGIFKDPFTQRCIAANIKKTTIDEGISGAIIGAMSKLIRHTKPRPPAPLSLPMPPAPLRAPPGVSFDGENTGLPAPILPINIERAPLSPLASSDPRLDPLCASGGSSSDACAEKETRRHAEPAPEILLPVKILTSYEERETPENFANELCSKIPDEYHEKALIHRSSAKTLSLNRKPICVLAPTEPSITGDLSLIELAIHSTHLSALKNSSTVFFLILRASDFKTISEDETKDKYIKALLTQRNVYFIFIDQIFRDMVPVARTAPRCIFSPAPKGSPEFSGFIHVDGKLFHQTQDPDAHVPLTLNTVVAQFVQEHIARI